MVRTMTLNALARNAGITTVVAKFPAHLAATSPIKPYEMITTHGQDCENVKSLSISLSERKNTATYNTKLADATDNAFFAAPALIDNSSRRRLSEK
jgi:hypothetical protein